MVQKLFNQSLKNWKKTHEMKDMKSTLNQRTMFHSYDATLIQLGAHQINSLEHPFWEQNSLSRSILWCQSNILCSHSLFFSKIFGWKLVKLDFHCSWDMELVGNYLVKRKGNSFLDDFQTLEYIFVTVMCCNDELGQTMLSWLFTNTLSATR